MGAEMCHNCDDDKIRRKVKGECLGLTPKRPSRK